MSDNKILQTIDEQGFGSLSGEAGNLPLAAMDVDVKVTGLISRVTLEQTFVNNLDEPLEATYIFPLPPRAAVMDFEMTAGGRTIKGMLKERGEARQDYETAIEKGQRAAIAEEERPGVFTMRVGNVMPGETALVRLVFSGPLAMVDGEATFRFPLVVAPRYIPGRPLDGLSVGDGTVVDTDAVPDASRITPPVLLPGYPNPVRLGLQVTLDPAGLQIGDPCSSLHTVVTEAADKDVVQLRLEPGERLDRDFILRFRVNSETVETSLVLHPDDGGQGGSFLLTLVPPESSEKTERPRDVVFVLDRSGSMGGWKMVAARRALGRMVDTLGDDDRFSVLAFDNDIETPGGKEGSCLHAATDRQRFAAVEFLARVDARGGTEMMRPLDRALDLLSRSDEERDRMLVLVTDGQVGNESQILGKIGRKLREVRVFALGIDQAVNEGFLGQLAAAGGGTFDLVESEDRLDEVMDRVHRHISTPELTGLRIRSSGFKLEADCLVPERIPDLFAGRPLFLHGRYIGAPEGALQLRATGASGEAYAATIPARAGDHSAVSALWARGRVRALEDRHSTGWDGFSSRSDHESLQEEIIKTSLRFGVLCRFTAFVAVNEEIVNKDGELESVIQPVELPRGWESADDTLTRSCCILSSPLDSDTALMYRGGPQAAPAPVVSMTVLKRRLKRFLRELKGSKDILISSDLAASLLHLLLSFRTTSLKPALVADLESMILELTDADTLAEDLKQRSVLLLEALLAALGQKGRKRGLFFRK